MPITHRSRRLLQAGAGVLAIGAVAAGAWFLWAPESSGDIEGSTEGFVTSEVQTPTAATGTWPEYGFNARRTRANEALTLTPPFVERWRFAANSLIEFPPVIGEGRAVLGTNDGRAVAVDVDTGAKLWETQLAGQMASSPALTGDVALFTTTRGRLVALTAKDGARRWSIRLGTSSESSPLVVDGAAYVGTLDGAVLSVDVATGRINWRSRAVGDVKASLAVSGPNVVVGDYGGRISAYRRSDGSLTWRTTSPGPRFRGSGRFYAGPAVAYGRVYLGNINARMVSLQADTGEVAWVRTLGDFIYSSAAISQQLVFVGSYDHVFYALDAATGNVKWKADLGERISGSPSVIGSNVYVSTLARGGRKGETFAFDVTSGREVWTFPDGRYSPAVGVDGMLVLAGRQVLYGLAPA